jgi:uncharacterized membrane protein YdfJ with MMPL/SSD domain
MVLFDRIADLSIKHYKKVIAFWMILFLASLPFFLNISDVLEYSETGMLSSDSEVVKASDLIEEQFPGLQSNSSVMIVISADDVTSDAVRDYCLQVGSIVMNTSKVPLYDSFLSFYGMEITYMTQFGAQMDQAMFSTIDSVQQVSGMIYGVPATFIAIRQGMDADPVTTPAQKDQMALDSTLDALSVNGDPDSVQMLKGYMQTLYQAYNTTYDIGSPSYQKDGTIDSRMDAAIRSTAPTFFQFASPSTQQQQMMALVYSRFDLSNWDSDEIARAVAYDMLRSAIPGFTLERSFFQGLYDLGRNATVAQIAAHAVQVASSTSYDDLPLKLPKEIVSQFISPDNGTMLIIVGLSEGEYSTSPRMKQSIDGIHTVINDIKDSRGLDAEVYITGSVVISYDTKDSAESTLKIIEPVTVVLLLVIIGLIFLSVMAPTVPLGIIFISITITQAVIYFLAITFLDVQYMITTILFTVTMGAGVDYCIFILARFREERMKGRSKEDAVRESVKWAGESITTSGLAVMIGFGALSLARFQMLKVMGILLALAIFMALLVSLTLLPSFIMLIGNKVFWPSDKRWLKAAEDKKNGSGKQVKDRSNIFHRAGSFAIKRAKFIVPIALIVTLPAVYMVLTLDVSYDSIAGMPPAESKTGMQKLGAGFGEGIIMPTSLVVRSDTPIIDDGYDVDTVLVAEVEALAQRILAVENVKSVETSLTVLGRRIDHMDWSGMSDQERELYAVQAVGKDRSSVNVKIVLSEGPFTERSLQTIDDIREEVKVFQGLSNTTKLSNLTSPLD